MNNKNNSDKKESYYITTHYVEWNLSKTSNDKASILDDAIEYVKSLQLQIQVCLKNTKCVDA
ncbi:hypothetical protein H8356DRAFT_1359892 [Neocallimastix lanati (nom. inval.)]|nr:hypothetical protein H8356DRAFT_1359892 [Neocallimastix sp. JGI-2020a]